MKIWIINPYGNIPGEGWSPYRATFLAMAAAGLGHEVTWWVANFEHRSKKFRSKSWQRIKISPGFYINIVPSTEYRGHISIKRIQFERNFARNLVSQALIEKERPDVIVHAEPALFISDITGGLSRKLSAKLVIDVLDLWPELFAIKIPIRFNKFERLLLSPAYLRRKRFFKKADGIIAVTKDYQEKVMQISPETQSALVYCGVDTLAFKTKGNHIDSQLATEIHKQDDEILGIYAGTLGENYDISTLLAAMDLIGKVSTRVKILIAGDGPLKQMVEKRIRNSKIKNVKYLGRVDMKTLVSIYQMCDFAISSYVKKSTVSMPLKAFDYFAAELPVINSLDSEFGRIILENNVGIQYEAQNVLSMFEALSEMSNNHIARQQFKLNSKKIAFQFDWRNQYSKAVEFIEKIASEKT